jgi:GNAT superfamily N-acetyltransferase
VAETKTVVVRRGSARDAARLKEIAVAAKAHWGYGLERVREWADAGDFTPETLGRMELFVAVADGEAIGWASLKGEGAAAWLEDLWVEPGWIGRGVGSRLFREAAASARGRAAKAIEWEAEPNAVGFYEKLGGRHVRDGTSEWGRTLPIMRADLDA